MNFCAIQPNKWEYVFPGSGDLQGSKEEYNGNDRVYTSMVEAEVMDNKTITLLDTGAEHSLCSTAFWKEVSRMVSKPQLRKEADICLVDYSGTRKKGVKGITCLPIQIGRVPKNVDFYVVDHPQL